MEHSMPGTCPVCQGEMAVTSLQCKECESQLTGHFKTCPFCRLDPHQTRFTLTFLKARGSIKEVERELGISYPTVRSRLADVLRGLGFEEEQEGPPPANRREILARLERGEISADEAAGQLKGK